MKQNHPTIVPYHREFNPARQIIFEIIVRILKRFEPILQKHINHFLEVERYIVTVPGLPVNISGAYIVHISDMHFHEKWEPEKMTEALLEKLKIIKHDAEKSPVICVFTGDILSKHTNFSAVQPHIIRFMNRFREIF